MMNYSIFVRTGVAVLALLVSQFAFAGQAGTVTFKTGDVTITRADKTVIKAEKNVVLNAGDTIETKDGRVQLALIDGGKVSLQPNTIYRINKYEFSGKEDGTEYGFTELIKGGLRTISGLIGHKNRDRYQLKTAVATIGIRGTEFTVNFNNNQLIMTTNHGSVDVCNEGGCLNATTGQSIGVAGPGAKPKPSDIAATASAAAPATEKTDVASNNSEESKSDSASDSKSDTQSSPTKESTTTDSTATDVTVNADTKSDSNTALDTRTTTTDTVTDTKTALNSGSSNSGPGSINSGSGSASPVFTAAGSTTSTGIPTIIAPSMADGPGTIVALATDTCGCTYNGIFNADLKFEKNGALKEARKSGNEITPNTNNFVSFNTDGIVAWGQLTDAKYIFSGANFNPMRLDYIAGATPNVSKLANLTGTYTVFGSTAPFIVSGTSATTIGAPNAVNGSLNFNFSRYTFGYNINVPTVAWGTFNLAGSGSLATTGTFATTGTVTNGVACAVAGCSGALGGNLIQGAFLGANGERVGLQYGIYAPFFNGKIYGGAVLK